MERLTGAKKRVISELIGVWQDERKRTAAAGTLKAIDLLVPGSYPSEFNLVRRVQERISCTNRPSNLSKIFHFEYQRIGLQRTVSVILGKLSLVHGVEVEAGVVLRNQFQWLSRR